MALWRIHCCKDEMAEFQRLSFSVLMRTDYPHARVSEITKNRQSKMKSLNSDGIICPNVIVRGTLFETLPEVLVSDPVRVINADFPYFVRGHFDQESQPKHLLGIPTVFQPYRGEGFGWNPDQG